MKIAIDDYGVGYSSMSRLLEPAIDELKIDRSFVMRLSSDPRAQAIVRSAVELARALNLVVVGEGIECEGTPATLRDIGADVGQGNLIGEPMMPRQLDDFLTRADSAGRPFGQMPPLLVTRH